MIWFKINSQSSTHVVTFERATSNTLIEKNTFNLLKFTKTDYRRKMERNNNLMNDFVEMILTFHDAWTAGD